MSRSHPLNILDLLVRLERNHPRLILYRFLSDDGGESETLTCAELAERTRSVAASLREVAGGGDRALLFFDTRPEMIIAFFGCLQAGIIPVPIPPLQRKDRDSRLEAIRKDCEPVLALAAGARLSSGEQGRTLGHLTWIDVRDLPRQSFAKELRPMTDTCAPAFLQYTSGSTSAPRGVMVSHHNLLANAASIQEAFNLSSESSGVMWLPLYHDMGLIGGVFQPLYSAYPTTFLSPAAFIEQPLRWLRAISRFRASVSGGPDFAYSHCVRRVRTDECASLDLSCWTVAFNGAETVRQSTIDRFCEVFGQFGFRRGAFYPCYGLAEATLLVSAKKYIADPEIRYLDREALALGEIRADSQYTSKTLTVMACGNRVAKHVVTVVDLATSRVCAPGRTGEIWISGPHVAQGYWGRAEETQATFAATLPEYPGEVFLRTGDLGFIDGETVFITGRLKDLIIIRGRNYYPPDIEMTVRASHDAISASLGAAFSVEVSGEERIVIVQEIDRHFRGKLLEVAAAAGRAVQQRDEVSPHAIVFLRSGAIPRTSSGKVRRQECRRRYLDGVLPVIEEHVFEQAGDLASPHLDARELRALSPEDRAMKIELRLRVALAHFLQLDAAQIDSTEPLTSLGLDSMIAARLKALLEGELGVRLGFADLLAGASLRRISAIASARVEAHADAPSGERALPTDDGLTTFPLSVGQQAVWFMQQLDPGSSAHQITRLIRIHGFLNAEALRRSLRRLVDRHPLLRMTVRVANGVPLHHFTKDPEAFECIEPEAVASDEAELIRQAAELGRQPFDLERGPILRVGLFTVSEDRHLLLFSIHHLAADLWSLVILFRELREAYEAEVTGRTWDREYPTSTYADYVRWQSEMLTGAEGERLWAYWQDRLQGELETLALPVSRATTDSSSFKGGAWEFDLDVDLTERLSAVCRRHQSTLYTCLLAAFQALLYRYTGQEEIIVGTICAGRTSSRFSEVIGYFINPVVIRSRIDGRLPFASHLQSTHGVLVGALEHQDFPFPRLAERLRLGRDATRPPLLRALCLFQPAIETGCDISGFMLGRDGASFEVSGWRIESVACKQTVNPFDLTLVAAEGAGRIRATFEYNCELFDREAIGRLAEHFTTLLRSVTDNTAGDAGSLPLLTSAEISNVLYDWNQLEQTPPVETATIHELIERWAERQPGATAVEFAGERLSYGELNRHADNLARRLRQIGIGLEGRVGVCVERSNYLVIALIGILKAGCAYVPLDPLFPDERLKMMASDADLQALVTTARFVPRSAWNSPLVLVDELPLTPEIEGAPARASKARPENLAYVMFTSGSTGRPKGVMVSHANVVRFFHGMTERIGCGPDDTILAVTGVSFDISVLELLWTLSRGARVIMASEQSMAARRRRARPDGRRDVHLSLFYFASEESDGGPEVYRLLVEGAKMADRLGFTAIWTPERHFHPFGGLYPNPSATSAALATITERVQLRAGSVVLPLHHPIRVAEEWAFVDRLSHGRTGLAFASGWHANDFVFFPEHYGRRKELMFEGIEIIKRLWRGEAARAQSGSGEEIEVRIYPRPIQPELPIWITAAGDPNTFVGAARIGANVLTHLLGQGFEDVGRKIQLYREAFKSEASPSEPSTVTLMLHTYIDESEERVRGQALEPFIRYLRSSFGLTANLIRSLGLDLDVDRMSAQDVDDLLAFAAERYLRTSGLFGTPKACIDMLDRITALGVNEVACLIDFGMKAEVALAGIERLKQAHDRLALEREAIDTSVPALLARHAPSMFQCTPSQMRVLLEDASVAPALAGLRVLMLGGEPLPPSVVGELNRIGAPKLHNMYGPTETTIWSTTAEVITADAPIHIGRPIVGTRAYVLSRDFAIVPVGGTGEVHLGGGGVTRGYLGAPGLTAERFIPDPFTSEPGARLYRTGDLGRHLPDGTIQLIGRSDQQVKLRGHRIELGEIESAMVMVPGIAGALVAKEESGESDRLIAYLTVNCAPPPSRDEIRSALKHILPDHMLPSLFIFVDRFPTTPNGKLDRKALLAISSAPSSELTSVKMNEIEGAILSRWKQILRLDTVGLDDNFFDLGGHSLLLAQAHHALQQTLGREFPLIALLEHPTIRSLAHYLGEATPSTRSAQSSAAHRQRGALARQRERAIESRKPTR